jgi:YebC/PmpR family DNA-binding regulatory protein
MAGHSKFKNIMHRKGAQDKKRAKQFTKLVREIIVSVKTGSSPDITANDRLRAAVVAARNANLPKDKIEGAIKKASSPNDGENYESMRYEGYGPGGVAFIVEALTDNKNRTASEVRAAFTKYGGALGETGSVSYMFNRCGMIRYAAEAGSGDDFLEASIEGEAENCLSNEEGHEITTTIESFNDMVEILEKKFGKPLEASITWVPLVVNALTEDNAPSIFKLIDVLEDNDDVQNVVGNFEVPEHIADKLA